MSPSTDLFSLLLLTSPPLLAHPLPLWLLFPSFTNLPLISSPSSTSGCSSSSFLIFPDHPFRILTLCLSVSYSPFALRVAPPSPWSLHWLHFPSHGILSFTHFTSSSLSIHFISYWLFHSLYTKIMYTSVCLWYFLYTYFCRIIINCFRDCFHRNWQIL